MKIALRIIICVAAVIALLASLFLPQPLNYDIASLPFIGCNTEVVSSFEDGVTVKKTDSSPLKILMFTDLHLDGKNETSFVTVDNLVNNIIREKPDLVLLGGDNVTSGLNRKRSHQLAEIFEKLGVYWGGVIGNHEGDNAFSISRKEMVKIFSSYSRCLMREGLSSVEGNCNYYLSITDSEGKHIHTFFCLDSFDMMSDERKAANGIDNNEKAYDGVHESQIKWYSEKAAELRSDYGEYESSIITHIPIFQMKQAAQTQEFLFGSKLENVCSSAADFGLFDAVKASGTTKAIFFGHDHLNNFALELDGIRLSYIEPSGYGSYTTASRLGYEEKDWIQGYTRLTFTSGGKFEQTQLKNSEIKS